MSTLIRKVIQGDKAATILFYKTYNPKIIRYLSKKMPTLEDAQDIAQDVFMDALDSISFLKNEEQVLNWLYKIAHNKMADYYRRKKVKSIFLSQLPFLQLVDKEVHEPEFIFEKNKIREKLEHTFTLLPLRQQRILKLHYEENVSVKDISIQLSLSFKATESLLYRSRQNFKKIYGRTEISFTT